MIKSFEEYKEDLLKNGFKEEEIEGYFYFLSLKDEYKHLGRFDKKATKYFLKEYKEETPERDLILKYGDFLYTRELDGLGSSFPVPLTINGKKVWSERFDLFFDDDFDRLDFIKNYIKERGFVWGDTWN